jgi:tetratricopeptide (TPR) repeat protein
MSKYKLINNITGWVAFLIAAIVYLLTLEPTASFWDCGQFILLAHQLQVGHPPGAPFYMLMANLFSQFASDPSQVAVWVNAFSAIASAFTILFLFWTITHLVRKLFIGKKECELSLAQTIVIIGSGLVGALAFTFSTSFWFSAVEAEVYAFSSLMTAVVFWLILKWEDNADKPHADKWIVLIAYVMGLSIGVHLLNLLCIPAIVLVYYFKKKDNPTWKGTVSALLVSFGFILVLMYGIIPGFVKVGGWFELFFVNTLRMSYNSGLFVYLILLIGSIVWALFETLSPRGKEKRARLAFFISLGLSGVMTIGHNGWVWAVLVITGGYFAFKFKKMNMRFINLTMTCLMMILIGFSSYAMLPIRSSANPPLDLNSPEDIFSLGRVLSREQYGETPLFYGTTFASQVVRDANGVAVISDERRRWHRIVKTSPDQRDQYVYVTAPRFRHTNTMLFPRMHSTPSHPAFGNHIIGYERWGGVTDRNRPPTFIQNIRFLIDYQINFMYFRYLMWNFSGRQNDLQGDGGITQGNWITGIPFFDRHVLGLGPQDNIAPDIADNRGRNKYFMLPFLLGIIGILYQFRLKERGKQNFLVVFALFFMTGVAIVFYLNQTPFEPRERDYSFVGSFYAFAIWIGMGVAGISLFLKKYLKNSTIAATVATIACLFVPIQMATQNWDDHDRSGRTMARDMGKNYLVGLGENAIIFTMGDNDSFPLWYAQEVEGFRRDVRVANLSFLQIEWYIDQLLLQSHESPPVPINWTQLEYSDNERIMAHIISRREIENTLQRSGVLPHEFPRFFDMNAFRDTISLSQTLEDLRNNQSRPNNPFTTGRTQIIPGDLLYMEVDTSEVDWAAMHASPTDRMVINLGRTSLISRAEMMILEMLNNINNDNWQREIHFATTVPSESYMNLHNMGNLSLHGITYQIVPGTALSRGVNTDRMFDNMVNKFRFGGLEENPNIHLDETNRRSVLILRGNFIQLVHALIEEGRYDKARIALDRAVTAMPSSAVPYGNEGLSFARAYYRLGETEKAEALIDEIKDRVNRNLDWFVRLRPRQINNTLSDIISRNINPLLFTTSIYQQFDIERYQILVDDLLERAQTFYLLGVPFVGDTILRELTQGAISGFHFAAGDPERQAVEEEVMDRTLRMMQHFSPRLLEHFQN